jgi:hypothetical protein
MAKAKKDRTHKLQRQVASIERHLRESIRMCAVAITDLIIINNGASRDYVGVLISLDEALNRLKETDSVRSSAFRKSPTNFRPGMVSRPAT